METETTKTIMELFKKGDTETAITLCALNGLLMLSNENGEPFIIKAACDFYEKDYLLLDHYTQFNFSPVWIDYNKVKGYAKLVNMGTFCQAFINNFKLAKKNGKYFANGEAISLEQIKDKLLQCLSIIYKEPAKRLEAAEKQFLAQCKEEQNEQTEEEARQEYLRTSAGANLQQFINGIADTANTEAVKTGFDRLDSTLDGGLYEGLITVGAISSLGKTSLCLQIADQVAASGHDALYFSLEMARAELMSKSISRHTVQLALERGIDTKAAKTARGITDGKRYINYTKAETQLIQDAVKAYGQYAASVYIQEGIGNIGAEQIRETIEKHIRYTGNRPLVIVDYLQILAPYDPRLGDKMNTDKAILELKRISRDCKIPVIAVSSFNRAGYNQEAAFEQLKESGAIEYTADLVLALQLKGAGEKNFNPTEEKKKNPRQVELVILKNRQGKVGDKIFFSYYPMFNFFREEGLTD